MAIEFGPNGVCEYETNTYDNEGKSASIIDVVNSQRETLFFRGITAGDGISVNLVDTSYPNGLGYSTGKTIQISSSGGSSSSVSVKDAGATGESIIGSAGVSNNTIPFKTISVSNGLEITEANDIITISASSGLGAKWFVITTETPDNTVGSDGDMLLNVNGEIFNKSSGSWVDSNVNIKGSKGDKGDIGETPTVTVGTTTTGAVGSNASVSIDPTSTSSNVILDFIIPKGATGEAGTGLVNKGDWVSGTTYTSGDYVFAATSDTNSSTSMFIYKGDGTTPSSITPADDKNNWVEFTAPAGQRGSIWTVSTSTTAPTSIDGAQIGDQYLTGDGNIYSLTSIDSNNQVWTKGNSIIGPKGEDGKDGKDGVSPTVTVGTTTTGAVGSNASVSIDPTSTSSNTILNFSIPVGNTGKDGTNGTNGKDGTKWFYNKSAVDSSSLKSEGGNIGDYCLIGTGEIYTLTAIDSSTGNETWTDSGINITGPKGDKGEAGTNGTDGTNGKNGATWYIGTLSNPTTSTIPTDPILSGKTINANDVYLGQDLYVYTYNGTMWTKSTTYLGSTSSGDTVSFDSTGVALGITTNGNANIYSLVGGTGITLSEGSNQITISTTGSSISSLVGSTTTTGISTLVQGDNVSFDTTTKGQLKISSTGQSGSSTLQSLTDVSSVNPQTGNILQYNSGSSKWIATAPLFTLSGNMSDVGITTASLADGQILTYRGVDKKWENVTLSVPVDIITGTLSVANGGTGNTSFTQNGIVIGNGTSGLSTTTAPTTAGTSLVWNGTSFEWDNNIGVAVQNNGTDQGTATTLNFTGTGVSTTTTSGTTTVNISGSGGSTKTVSFRLVFDNNSSNGATGNPVKVDSISDTSIISGTDQFTFNVDGAGGITFKTLLDDTYVSTTFIAMATNTKGERWDQYANPAAVTNRYDTNKILNVTLNSFASPNVGGTTGSANNNSVAYIAIEFVKISGTINPDGSIN